jgi:restriction system protein
MNEIQIPTYDDMMNPLLKSMNSLGGSGTISEIEDKVAEIMNLSDEQVSHIRTTKTGKGWETLFGYRLAWTRSYLKIYGLLENSTRGVWALTPKGQATPEVDQKEVARYVKEQSRTKKSETEEEEELLPDDAVIELWEDELLSTLLEMEPSAFERLIQRILRESGFVQVEVTGRSGDGGIDGKGIIRLSGLLSFHVFFQCKRYKGTVGSREVRIFEAQ